jgi:DNA invertase Pin-like site-specific DNA recombinase
VLKGSYNPNLPYRYVCYGRMSGDLQNPRSPDQQFATIEEVRKRLAYPWVHLRDFRDDAISGRLLRKREGFQEMLQAIRTRMLQIDLILVDTYERLGRTDELASIRNELFHEHGVLVLTADSNFTDPTSVSGRALAFVEQLRSVEEGRVKGHNVLRGKRDLIRQKKAWPGGPTPLGLRLQSVLTMGKNGGQEVDYNLLVRDPGADAVVARIYLKAKETGWGTSRLSKSFNSDPTIPAKFKPFSPDLIGYILDNPIYYGELVWEKNSTGIVNDTRILERNAEEDMLRVPDFCEAIVSRELWEEVQTLRQRRREQISRSRAGSQADGKLIRPRTPGLTLKYLLTGLARCGDCGASLRPSPSKRTMKSGRVWRRTYYACPSHIGGSCANEVYVPEDWLREAVIARLCSRLFPVPERAGQVPDWFDPLVEEVRQELDRGAREQPDQQVTWKHEKHELQERVSGWVMSLANPRLDPLLRTEIEAQYGQARTRIVELEAQLAGQSSQREHLAAILNPAKVLECLHRLADVLGGTNPTLGNLELALHIDRIDCFADGQVLMRTSRLGMFEGVVELLRRPVVREPGQQATGAVPRQPIKPRRRARHRIEEAPSQERGRLARTDQATDPERFAGLEDRWFWEDRLQVPQAASWAARHATEVAELRATGMTVAALAAHFGKTPPTIRNALALAKAADPSLHLPRKVARACWAREHAAEVAQMKKDGKSILAIARQVGKSEPTIRAALRYAEQVGTATSLPADLGNATTTLEEP